MQKKTPSHPPAAGSILRRSVTPHCRGLRLQPTQTTHQRELFAVPHNHTMSTSPLCFLFQPDSLHLWGPRILISRANNPKRPHRVRFDQDAIWLTDRKSKRASCGLAFLLARNASTSQEEWIRWEVKQTKREKRKKTSLRGITSCFLNETSWMLKSHELLTLKKAKFPSPACKCNRQAGARIRKRWK